MITITPNAKYLAFEKMFGGEMPKRMEWFYYEFGRKVTKLVHKFLLGRINQIKGTKNYKKRIVIAEIRDRSARSWFAIVAKALPLRKGEIDAKTSILHVVPRYELKEDNPIEDVLVNFGPWTADTIPFAPSSRQAAVIAKTVPLSEVSRVKRKNLIDMKAIQSFMDEHDLEIETRAKINEDLHIVPDMEIEALRLEFGLISGGQPHWRPAIRYAKRKAILMMSKDTTLLKAFTDPKFKGYRARRRVRPIMTVAELKALQKFQEKIQKAVG